MTAQNAKLAQGTLIVMANDEDGLMKLMVAEVTSISGPTMSSDLIDVTSQESLGGFREKIIGLTDPGELSFDIFFNQTLASHGVNDGVPAASESPGLLGTFSSKLLKYFQLQFPSNMATWQFAGVVNGFEIDASVDDALKASVTIAISGLPDFGAAKWV